MNAVRSSGTESAAEPAHERLIVELVEAAYRMHGQGRTDERPGRG
ncbi:hypothetical protein [Streptomyces pacificus]|nr:hypothetical protein [Streptomyces pacificus]